LDKSYAISGGGYDTVSMANFTATMIDNDTAAITQLATAAVTQLAISAHIRVIHSSNRNRLWTAPVASGKGE
jgi:hypothetical protein